MMLNVAIVVSAVLVFTSMIAESDRDNVNKSEDYGSVLYKR